MTEQSPEQRPRPTSEESYEQGRNELFAQIAHADGFEVETGGFVVDTSDDASLTRWRHWHNLTSILFVDSTPGTTAWHNMDLETRQRLQGRIDAMVGIVLAAHDLPEVPAHSRRGQAPKPVKLEQVLPLISIFRSKQE